MFFFLLFVASSLNFVFQTFPLFIPDIPASFISLIVEISPFISSESSSYCNQLVSFDVIILNIIGLTVAYASSIQNNLDSLLSCRDLN
jgi:hypothetical protein